MLVETEELSSYAFKILDEKLAKIEVKATYRECDGCFGASMGDCTGCRRFVVLGKIGDDIANAIDRIDNYIENTSSRKQEWIDYFRYKLFAGKHKKRGK